jgi:hypothetical protein
MHLFPSGALFRDPRVVGLALASATVALGLPGPTAVEHRSSTLSLLPSKLTTSSG